MKDFAYSREKDFNILLAGSALLLTLLHIIVANQHKPLMTFHTEFGAAASEDLDINLSGNSGISEDYYTKQLRKFAESNGLSN